MAKWSMSDEEFQRQYEEATKLGQEALEKEPRAKSAYYDRDTKRIVVDLLNGCTFMFPTERAQGLRGASAEELAEVEVDKYGFTLHWEKLDADFTVVGLMAGRLGTRQWMEELGREFTPAQPGADADAPGKHGDISAQLSSKTTARSPSKRKRA